MCVCVCVCLCLCMCVCNLILISCNSMCNFLSKLTLKGSSHDSDNFCLSSSLPIFHLYCYYI